MARQEQDREDLMREATGLVPRAELRIPGFPESVVFGFRRQGGLSLYFGGDPVYQFNSLGELRRAFANGELLKAENGRLVRLQRARDEREVTLWRTELEDRGQADLLGDLQSRCSVLLRALESRDYHLESEFPEQSGAIGRLVAFLGTIASPVVVAKKPNSI